MSVSAKRPRSISLVILILILMGGLEAARVVALYKQSALLLDLQVSPDPRLRLVLAAAWMVLFWIAAAALWRRLALTRWLIPVLFAAYFVYEMVLLGLFAQVPISTGRWLLNGLLALVLVSYAYWALNRNAANPYYSEDRQADG